MLDNYPDLISPTELRDILCVGKNKAYELLEKGVIQAFRLGRDWRISREDLEQFIRESCGMTGELTCKK